MFETHTEMISIAGQNTIEEKERGKIRFKEYKVIEWRFVCAVWRLQCNFISIGKLSDKYAVNLIE